MRVGQSYKTTPNQRKSMARYDAAHKHIRRNAHLRRTYGITLEQADAIRNTQYNLCAICDVGLMNGKSGAHLDHDHTTKRIRGFLCSNCNTGIGKLKDDPMLLRKAIDYLTRGELCSA